MRYNERNAPFTDIIYNRFIIAGFINVTLIFLLSRHCYRSCQRRRRFGLYYCY